MNNIQSNTGRISELSDSIQSLTLDLEEVANSGQRDRVLSLSNAINSIAESIGSEAEKIDQLCLEQAKPEPSNENPELPTVVNIHKEEEAQHPLNPAWYEYNPDGQITDLALVDGLDHCFNEVRAISVLLMSAGRDPDVVINESTLCQTALMLCDKMKEAKHFVGLWRKSNTDIKG